MLKIRHLVFELKQVIDEWQGPPLHPVIVEARELLGVAQARLLQLEVYAAVERRENGETQNQVVREQ